MCIVLENMEDEDEEENEEENENEKEDEKEDEKEMKKKICLMYGDINKSEDEVRT